MPSSSAGGLTRGWDSLTKDLYIKNSKDSESLTPAINGWNQKYNEFMLARYFLGEVGAAEVDPDILTEIQAPERKS